MMKNQPKSRQKGTKTKQIKENNNKKNEKITALKTAAELAVKNIQFWLVFGL